MAEPRLEIEFVGHCMFATETDRFTVLLPVPDHTSCHPGDLHHAVLRYCVLGADGKEEWKREPLENRELDLSLLGGEPFTAPDLSGIANIWRVTNQKLDRDLIDDANPINVHARVKVSHGSGAPVTTGPNWDLEGIGTGLRMTNRTQWTIRGITSTSLTLTGLHGTPDATLVIEPIDGVVKLEILHLPNKEEKPNPGDFAKHFGHYYALFPGFTGKRVLPRYKPRVDPGHLVTCMHARAPVGP